MSDEAQTASAAAGTAAAGTSTQVAAGTPPAATTPASPTPPPADTSGAPAGTSLAGDAGQPNNQDWTASLDDDTRQLVEQKGYKQPADIAKAYKELQAKLGERTVAPKDDAPKEEWDAFYKRIGRPDSADGYQFKMPEGVPENLPYDSDFAAEFRAWAHDQGLTPRQASGLHDKFVQRMASMTANGAQGFNERIQKAHSDLVQAWGDTDSEGYRTNVELASRTLRQNPGLTEALTSAGILDLDGRVTDAAVAKFLANTGRSMYREDSLYSGPNTNIDNPFAAKTENLTKQMMLIRSDPARAATLIRAAGKDPAEYGLKAA